jgi:hypothetical protein
MRVVQMAFETLAVTDETTIAVENLSEGKIKVNTSSWPEPKIMFPHEVLEIRVLRDSRMWLSPKDKDLDPGDMPISVYDPYDVTPSRPDVTRHPQM